MISSKEQISCRNGPQEPFLLPTLEHITALAWAHFRLHVYGWGQTTSSISNMHVDCSLHREYNLSCDPRAVGPVLLSCRTPHFVLVRAGRGGRGRLAPIEVGRQHVVKERREQGHWNGPRSGTTCPGQGRRTQIEACGTMRRQGGGCTS